MSQHTINCKMGLAGIRGAEHGPHDAKRATPKHILRAVKQRVTARVQYEHDRALHASREQPKPSAHKSAWATFIGHWIATGIASIRKGGTRLNLLSPPPPAQQLPANAVHIRVTATLHPARGKQPPKAAWAIAVEDLDEAPCGASVNDAPCEASVIPLPQLVSQWVLLLHARADGYV